MNSDCGKWLIADLKKLARDTRRIIRHRSLDALSPPQQLDLYNTCQDTINALEETKQKVKPRP